MSPTRVLREPASARAGAASSTPAPARQSRFVAPRTVASERALTRGRRLAFWALTVVWVAVVARFWLWWLEPSHRGALGLCSRPASRCCTSRRSCRASTGSSSGGCGARSTWRRHARTPRRDDHALRALARDARRNRATSSSAMRRSAIPTTAGCSTRAPRPTSAPRRGARRPLLHAQGAAVEPARPPFQGHQGRERQRLARQRRRARGRLRGVRPARHRPSPRPDYLDRSSGTSATPGRLGAGAERVREPRQLGR